MQGPHNQHRLLRRIVAAAAAMVLALVILELAARSRYPPPRTSYIWPPGLERVFHPDPAVVAGIQGPSRLAIDTLGLRADEPGPRDEYRIVAVGGSTTECLYLDQSETWPQLVQSGLRSDTGWRVWVGNAGRSGHTTREHVLQVEHLADAVPRPDALLIMAGANDLCQRLARGEAFDPHFMDRPAARHDLERSAFSVLPDGPLSPLPRYKQTALWRLVSGLRARLFPDPLSQKDTASMYLDWRARRARASATLDRLPALDDALEEFRANLRHCVEYARARGVRVILIDQPAIWRADLPAALRAHLWLGGVGDYTHLGRTPYYSVGALAQGIARYNSAVHELASELEIESIGLAAELPREGEYFYDGVHFTERGARRVARVVAEFLAARPPLDAPPAPR